MNPFQGSLRPLILVGSLLANAALAHLLFRPEHSAEAYTPTAQSIASITAESDDEPLAPLTTWWNQLDCDDPAELVTRLRSAGVPERLVRGILWERLETDRKHAAPTTSDLPYWQRLDHQQDPTVAAKRRQASEFKMSELKRALGGQPYDVPYPGWFQVRAALDGLSPESALRRNWLGEARYEHQLKLESALPPNSAPNARRAMFEELEKEESDGLRAALSPAEYDALMLRNPPEMSPLLSRATGLDLSLAEYTTLLDLAHSSPMSLFDPAVQPQIAAALGADRYADFEQALRGSQKTNRLLDRLDLPLRTATTIDTVREDIRARATAVHQDPSLDEASRQQHLSDLITEARQRLTAVLTPTGYDAYYEYRGEWLDEITSPPSTGINAPGP